jgi:hypothetical protein
MRAVLDRVDPIEIRAPFIQINQRLYDQGILEGFRYFNSSDSFWGKVRRVAAPSQLRIG